MTTDRLYGTALRGDRPTLQLSAGRGKKFNPAVVDAFLESARRRPGDVVPPESPSLPLAASG